MLRDENYAKTLHMKFPELIIKKGAKILELEDIMQEGETYSLEIQIKDSNTSKINKKRSNIIFR